MDIRITVISDTHCRHEDIDLPAGDLLIHCGDMFNLFSASSGRIADIDDWFGRQPFERILCTGGNHDRELEFELAERPQPFANAQFLNGEVVHFRGLKIYGAPWVPDLPRHAFFKDQAGLAGAWAQIPADIDILVTHTPPKGILDTSRRGQSLGCTVLAAALQRIRPRVHCFGHVHASAGHHDSDDTLFINASSIASGTDGMRAPISFTLSARSPIP